MSTMELFYETEIKVDPSTPYALLAQATPEDILAGDLLDWVSW